MSRPSPRLTRLLDGWWWYLAPVVALVWQTARLWDLPPFARIDFAIYYEAVGWEGGSLYDFRHAVEGLPFNYPPFAALVLRPLNALSLDVAEHAWFVASSAATVAFALLVLRSLPRLPTTDLHRAAAVTLLLLMMPATLTLRMGQINAFVGLLVMLDVLLLQRESRWAGVGTGLAAGLKVTPALVAVGFAGGGRVRAAVTAVAAGAVTVAVGAIVHPGATWHYATDALWDNERVGPLDIPFMGRLPDGTAADVSNSLRRPVSWLPVDPSLHTLVWIVLAVGVAVVAIRRARRCFDTGNVLGAITVVSCAGYLITPITWGHHLLFLGVAVVLLAGDGTSAWRLVASLAGALVVIDPFEGGEGNYVSLARIVLCVLVVLALPLDRPDAADEPGVASSMARPRRDRREAAPTT